jgi:hypothetical protein
MMRTLHRASRGDSTDTVVTADDRASCDGLAERNVRLARAKGWRGEGA